VFQQDSARLLTMESWRLQKLHSSHALAVNQPRFKSDGLHNVVSNAGEGLQKADQGRRRLR